MTCILIPGGLIFIIGVLMSAVGLIILSAQNNLSSRDQSSGLVLIGSAVLLLFTVGIYLWGYVLFHIIVKYSYLIPCFTVGW